MGNTHTIPLEFSEEDARRMLQFMISDEKSHPGRVYSTRSDSPFSGERPKGNRKQRRAAAAKARKRSKHK